MFFETGTGKMVRDYALRKKKLEQALKNQNQNENLEPDLEGADQDEAHEHTDFDGDDGTSDEDDEEYRIVKRKKRIQNNDEQAGQFRQDVQYYALKNGKAIKFTRSAKLKNVYKHGLFSTMVEGHNIFKRMFVGFDALKKEFLGDCRPVISLDECFLKSESDGQLLSAVGRDENNKMFLKKKRVGYALKNLFWKVLQFNEHMYEMKVLSQVTHDDFIKIGSEKFCRFKISTLPKCDIIDNNMSECFNGYILRARNRLLIDMLEVIKRTIMKRMAEKRVMIMKSDDTICPKIRKKVEDNKVVSGFCIATHAGYKKFEVKHMDNNYVVELEQNSCSCRMWELSGIPCPHVISSIHWLGEDLTEYVYQYFKKSTYLRIYEHLIQPLNEKKIWAKFESEPILPPIVRRQTGRPKRARNKDISKKEKEETSTTKMSKKGVQMKYTQYQNKRSCKNMDKRPVSSQPSSSQGKKRGRPHKNQGV
ncbi:hypothetical protein Cni_G16864 [Canna indica]|uniref:SWIM-type domain-containing protein n=1 Tax=Canna indica TaxID=4628 RepID=A0AAQ3KG80_9LILI|nr:hypothetical protein Cni_G16864 [Canna indica]